MAKNIKLNSTQILGVLNSREGTELLNSKGIKFDAPLTPETFAASSILLNTNEVITSLTNLIAVQLSKSVFTFQNKYGKFQLANNEYGDQEIINVSDIATIADYDKEANPGASTASSEPFVKQSLIVSKPIKQVQRTIMGDLTKGAMITAEQFANLISVLLEGVNNAQENYLWQTIGGEIVANYDNLVQADIFAIVPDFTTTVSATRTKTDIALDALRIIQGTAKNLEYPSKDYNAWSLTAPAAQKITNATPIINQVMLANPNLDIYLGVNGFAAMYHNEYLAKNVPALIEDIQFTPTKVIIANPSFYAWDFRLNKITSFYNPAADKTTYYLTFDIRTGFVDGVNAVVIDFAQAAPTPPVN